MRILEAWARGTPVVASPAAIAGLDATAGVELLVAHDADAFVSGIASLHEQPGLATALTERGRAVLESRHSLPAVASQLADVYRHSESARRAG